MKKTYIEPTVDVISMQTVQFVAASGDTNSMGITDTEYNGSFGGRSNDGDDW